MALKIEVARDSSFCPGVSRAFRITRDTLFGKRVPMYSIGPLIHNPKVVSRLSELGLKVIDPESEQLPNLEGASVIIRSHGIDTATEERLARMGAVLVDATCPTVKHAQEAARQLVEAGYTVVILGSATHPEVRSIMGRANGPVTVLESAEEASRWVAEEGEKLRRVGIVCQTTMRKDLLDSVVAILKGHVIDLEVRDTICSAVLRRWEEAAELSNRVDLMLVVGGRNSSNTTHLAEFCARTGVPTYLIEEPSEIQPEWLEGVESVGVAGGASTPKWQIQKTVEKLRHIAAERE
jgi:4-hydroxy-3-methylbut-2-enyl diphosphate reductase